MYLTVYFSYSLSNRLCILLSIAHFSYCLSILVSISSLISFTLCLYYPLSNWLFLLLSISISLSVYLFFFRFCSKPYRLRSRLTGANDSVVAAQLPAFRQLIQRCHSFSTSFSPDSHIHQCLFEHLQHCHSIMVSTLQRYALFFHASPCWHLLWSFPSWL
jgi:hypothetical protein